MNIPKQIIIDKKGRALYFRMPQLEIKWITNFIYNINENDVILIIPFITISNNIRDPYICLSSQFLITNNSNSVLIYKFLNHQLSTAFEQYKINYEEISYNLYFKHKKVNLFFKEF